MYGIPAAFAQPRMSPGLRADRETEWMRDSLHISNEQAKKVNAISLKYNEEMDKFGALPPKQKAKKQKPLMSRKDADIKNVLCNEAHYKMYMRREKEIRRIDNVVYKGPHQPL